MGSNRSFPENSSPNPSRLKLANAANGVSEYHAEGSDASEGTVSAGVPSRLIDLHIHSTASDGTVTPREIVALVQQTGLSAFAITDHDTIEGAREAQRHLPPDGPQFLSGVEISALPPEGFTCSGSFHILGYGIDLDHPVLSDTLMTLQTARKNRNPRIIDRLNELGLPITLDEVKAVVKEGQMGRPHIARIMVRKGYATSINAAFDNYLGRGQPAFVDKFRITTAQAIEAITRSGGIAVLAHPALLDLSPDASLEQLIVQMKSIGLQGIEVFYSEHSPHQVAEYETLAHKLGLLMSGGTDFHGTLKPNIQLGTGSGTLAVPHTIYESIIQNIHKLNLKKI